MTKTSPFPEITSGEGSKLKFHYSFLKILTGSDLSRRRLPYMSAVSPNEGPVVWLTGCVHGDEVGGMVVIQEVFRRLRKAGLKQGSVRAFPLMNPIGFETGSRNITLSKEDLNRSFPGNSTGSLAERIAGKIFDTITGDEPDLVLDLHNDWMQSIPYSVVDPKPESMSVEMYNLTADFARHTGFLNVLDTDILPGTLSNTLMQRNIPALTLELGESNVVNETNVQFGLKSVWNLLAALDMVNPGEPPFTHDLARKHGLNPLEFSARPVSSTSGVIRFAVRPGDLVRRGQTVARIYNSFGKQLEKITALQDGVVLGLSDSSVSFPGAPVMAFGNV